MIQGANTNRKLDMSVAIIVFATLILTSSETAADFSLPTFVGGNYARKPRMISDVSFHIPIWIANKQHSDRSVQV